MESAVNDTYVKIIKFGDSTMNIITGGVTAAKGFKAASCEANIKYKNRTDMAMVFSEAPCVSAGTFTSNVVKAACVQWDMKIVASDAPVHAVVINSGIANACPRRSVYRRCSGIDRCHRHAAPG